MYSPWLMPVGGTDGASAWAGQVGVPAMAIVVIRMAERNRKASSMPVMARKRVRPSPVSTTCRPGFSARVVRHCIHAVRPEARATTKARKLTRSRPGWTGAGRRPGIIARQAPDDRISPTVICISQATGEPKRVKANTRGWTAKRFGAG